jgi:large subunit ribosomal protein L25
MSSDKILLTADKREATGKKVKALRRDGQIPATVYEKGKDSLSVQLSYMPLLKAWQKAGKHHPIELTVDGTTHLTMIKDVAHDPVKATLTHVSFHAINKNEKVEAEVPLHMDGNAPAQQLGLLVRLNVDHVVVKGLPNNIPNEILVDVSGVSSEEDDIRAVSLIIPSDVELVDMDPDQVIVSVTVPRAEVEKPVEEEVDVADVPSDKGGEKPAEGEE